VPEAWAATLYLRRSEASTFPLVGGCSAHHSRLRFDLEGQPNFILLSLGVTFHLATEVEHFARRNSYLEETTSPSRTVRRLTAQLPASSGRCGARYRDIRHNVASNS